MQWLRNRLARRIERLATPARRPNAFRPTLETLDERALPSVTSVLTATGLHQFTVDNTNSLVLTASPLLGGGPAATIIQGTAPANPANLNQPGTGVRTAQAFRTADGNIGFDAVMLDGTWRHFEQPGPMANANLFGGTDVTLTAAQLGLTGQIIDVGTAYSSTGQLFLNILVNTTTAAGVNPAALNSQGTLFQFSQAAGGGIQDSGLGNNVRWVSTYLDVNGGTGTALGQVMNNANTGANSVLLVRKADSAGIATLYNGFQPGGAAITEYSQTVSPMGASTIPGNVLGVPATSTTPLRVVIDITFDADTSNAAAFDPTATYALSFDSGIPGVLGAPATGFGVSSIILNNTVKPGG